MLKLFIVVVFNEKYNTERDIQLYAHDAYQARYNAEDLCLRHHEKVICVYPYMR